MIGVGVGLGLRFELYMWFRLKVEVYLGLRLRLGWVRVGPGLTFPPGQESGGPVGPCWGCPLKSLLRELTTSCISSSMASSTDTTIQPRAAAPGQGCGKAESLSPGGAGSAPDLLGGSGPRTCHYPSTDSVSQIMDTNSMLLTSLSFEASASRVSCLR